jgi:hypothetical protein
MRAESRPKQSPSPRSLTGRLFQKLTLALLALHLIQNIALPPLLAAGDEQIRNVKVEMFNDEIVVSAELIEGFKKEIVADILNGIPKDFYYYLLLKRKQKNWFDEEILSKTIRYTVKYDTLKKQYRVLRKEVENEVESTLGDFEAVKRLISKVDHVKLAPVGILKSRHRYYVSVKSQMKASQLPFYLDYFLFFIPFLELDTPWADSGVISAKKGG